jgi:arabinan endo-1,5-alpha-L-arabinosidase
VFYLLAAVLLAADGRHYAYTTQTYQPGKRPNIQVARSPDLVHWEHLGDALPTPPRWASATWNFWAPHVVLHDQTYCLYFSAEKNWEGNGTPPGRIGFSTMPLISPSASAPPPATRGSGSPARC